MSYLSHDWSDVIDLRELNYFVVVAEEEHVGHAADILGISQSPLSRQIAKLENRLGLRLFDRAQKRISLTSDGRVFLAEAKAVLRHADRLENLGRRLGRGEEGGLCIGYVADAMSTDILPRALRDLHSDKPGVHVALYGLRPEEQFEGLRQRSLDIAFVCEPPAPDDPQLLGEQLLEDPLILAMPAGDPLVPRNTISPDDLRQQPWIAVENDQHPGRRDSFLTSCVQAGFTPSIKFETTDTSTALGLVASGLGMAMIQKSLAQGAPAGVVVRELPWYENSVPLWAVWHRVDLRPLVVHFRKSVIQATVRELA